jgi:hypothetical protein
MHGGEKLPAKRDGLAILPHFGDAELHIERMLKLIGLGRNGWLHLGSDQGGTTAAVLYSFTASCKHQGINSFAYLRDVLTRLPEYPADRRAEFLRTAWPKPSGNKPPPPNHPTRTPPQPPDLQFAGRFQRTGWF